ncbi:MAG: efflux RND transporter periplasmic adaptor subunit, partial [Hyphomonadaceae bacterium]
QRATSAYERAESIRESGALSKEQIETRKADSEAAKARLAQARAAYEEWNSRMGGGFVRAPVAGLVIERPALVGQPVDGQTLFRIVADNALEVAADVSEADILKLKVGQTATFRMVDGQSVSARLRRPPAAIDSRTRVGAALFDLPRDARLRSGMFLRGEAELPTEPMLAAPQTAISYDKTQAYVFVIDEQNHARRTPVTVGDRDDDSVAVLSGLRAGARVAAGGAAFLQDGDLVRPVEREAPSVSAAGGGEQGG